VPATANNIPPPDAVIAGTDSDGTVIYVGRAHHEGDFLPAKVILGKQAAYVAYGGQEIFKDKFEVTH
jgi:co-chaperonin GroES (HSP10)